MINKKDNPEFLNSFLEYLVVILNKSPNTVVEYNYDLAHFLKYIMFIYKLVPKTYTVEDIKKIDIHDMSTDILKQITLDDIHSFLCYLTETYHCQAATRARKTVSIRVFFNYLTKKEKILEISPAQCLETPKIGSKLPRYLSLEESKRLLEACKKPNEDGEDEFKERNYAIITIFLNCGIRLSELVGINFEHIIRDGEGTKLTVIGKGNKERTVYLNEACVRAINDYLKVRPTEGVAYSSSNALFLSKRKKRISTRMVQDIVKKELSKADLDTSKYSVHKLRHTAATLMYQYGNIDIRTLQILLGHENVSTTEIYTHVDNKQIKEAVDSNPLAYV